MTQNYVVKCLMFYISVWTVYMLQHQHTQTWSASLSTYTLNTTATKKPKPYWFLTLTRESIVRDRKRLSCEDHCARGIAAEQRWERVQTCQTVLSESPADFHNMHIRPQEDQPSAAPPTTGKAHPQGGGMVTSAPKHSKNPDTNKINGQRFQEQLEHSMSF